MWFPVGVLDAKWAKLRIAGQFGEARHGLPQIITIESGKRGGKPCVRGLRISVYDVLSHLAAGMSEDEILADFPYLTREDIRAVRDYGTGSSAG